MQFSEQWLREWVDPPIDSAALCEHLSMAGLEVESRVPGVAAFSDVVVAEVVAMRPHSDADRLHVCQLRITAEEEREDSLKVVCGAPNVMIGGRYPYARTGALLPGGLHIKKRKIRGEVSQGMLCSAAELGLSENSEGILELPSDSVLGESVARMFGADDFCIGLDLTPNRGDCLSIRGIARDVAAISHLPFDEKIAIVENPLALEHNVAITLEAPDACPRYLGRVISEIGTGTAPLWLRERLRRAGIRSVSALVDIGNYVMIELGQPLHTFALAAAEEGVIVRRALLGERLELLDGSQITLQHQELLIANPHKPIALAGVMGSRDSGVGAESRAIFLESAFFHPDAVAGCARRHRLHSEAARRFERGVDPELPLRAIERASALITEYLGAKVGPLCVAESAAHLPPRPEIVLRRERIQSLLGIALEDSVVDAYLTALGVVLQATDKDGEWLAIPPSHRSDLHIEADLIEELIRLHGYDRLPESCPVQPCIFPALPRSGAPDTNTLRHQLAAMGYRETINYSFVSDESARRIVPGREPMALANPITEDMNVMRTSLWPGLLETMRHNRRRQFERLRLFEIGTCFLATEDPDGSRKSSEISRLGMLACGTRLPEHWAHNSREKTDFYDIAGDLESLLSLYGCSFRLKPCDAKNHPALHPGQSAALFLNDRESGVLGMIHPGFAAELDLETDIALLELNLADLQAADAEPFRLPVRQPALRRDLAVVVDEDLPAAEFLAAVREICSRALGAEDAEQALESVLLFDVYCGPELPVGRKSMAFRIGFRHPKHSFSDDQVNVILAELINGLKERFAAELRT